MKPTARVTRRGTARRRMGRAMARELDDRIVATFHAMTAETGRAPTTAAIRERLAIVAVSRHAGQGRVAAALRKAKLRADTGGQGKFGKEPSNV